MSLNVNSIVRAMRDSLPEEAQPFFDKNIPALTRYVRAEAADMEIALEQRAAAIRSALRARNVPAMKSQTTRVRGYHTYTSGLSISVGDETHRDAFQRNAWMQSEKRRRKWDRNYVSRPYARDVFPTHLIVSGSEVKDEWRAILAEIMDAEGMIETRPSAWRMR